jgi:hypothetical protein
VMETNMCTPRLAVDDDDVEFNSITLWLVMVKACTLPLRGCHHAPSCHMWPQTIPTCCEPDTISGCMSYMHRYMTSPWTATPP